MNKIYIIFIILLIYFGIFLFTEVNPIYPAITFFSNNAYLL